MRRYLGVVAAFSGAATTIVIVWWAFSKAMPAFLLPAPAAVFGRLVRDFQSEAFLLSLKSSLTRLGIGYVLALFGGTSIGLVAGVFRPVRLYTRALISVLQSVPPIAWVPLLLLVFGFGDEPIVIVITIASLFPMALSVMDGVDGVNRLHVEMVRVLGATTKQALGKVYMPAVLPSVFTGAQVSFGNAWRSLIAAEMVGGVNIGLGWSITYASEIADMGGVLAGIVTIGILAALLDRFVLEQAKHRLLRWRWQG